MEANQRAAQNQSESQEQQLHRAIRFALETIEKRYKILIFITIVAALSMVFSHIFYLPTYEAKSTIRIQTEQKVSIPGLIMGQQGYEYIPDSREMSRYLRYLQSESFQLGVGQALKFNPEFPAMDLTNPKTLSYFSSRYWKRFFSRKKTKEVDDVALKAIPLSIISQSSQDIAGKVAQLVKVESDNVELITITVNSLDPETSKMIANIYATNFEKMNQLKDHEELNSVENFIRSKLSSIADRLKDSESKMVSIQEKHHIYAGQGSSNGSDISSQLKEMELKKSELAVQQTENESMIKSLKESPTELPSVIDGPGINQKEVRDFKIAELERKNAEIEKQKTALTLLMQKTQDRFSALPKVEQEYYKLKREEELDYELYSSLVQRMSQIEIQKYSLFSKVSVESLARSGFPAPRVNLILKFLFTVFASFFFGTIIVLGIEWFDPTIRSVEDIESIGIEKIGIIPRITLENPVKQVVKNNLPQPDPEGDVSKMLIMRSNSKSIEAMSFKYIRARLQKITDTEGKPIKTILVAGATNGDGKSFVASNLAISFAQLGKKTLLLDCDFRHPTVNKYFNISQPFGLGSVLKMQHSLQEVIVQDQFEPKLHILPADKDVDDPTELLSDERILVLLEHLRSQYDYVIIDSPPLQMVVDGLILSSVVSNILIVSRYRKTLKSLLTKTYRDLMNVNFQQVYGILNDVKHSRLLQFLGVHSDFHYGNQAKHYYVKNSEETPFKKAS